MTLPTTPIFRLDGKRALVSGGTRGIGLGAAAALAQAGAEVTIVARNASSIDTCIADFAEAGWRIEGTALDLADIRAAISFVDCRPPFDILVNSAGLARHSTLFEIEPASYDAVMDLNVKATLFLSKAVAAQLVAAKRGGSIINVSSQMGHVGGPRRTVYCASKFAVEGLTRSMALELGPHGIRVNTLCPTFVETEFTAQALADPTFRNWVLSKIALGRLGRVEDIMGPVVFLASDASGLVTGSSLMVDGGWTAE